MDLIAYENGEIDIIKNYLNKYYGEIPRFRGARIMKLEDKVEGKPKIDVTDMFGVDEEIDYTDETRMFNKYAGKDVIYIRTRCGACVFGYDNEDSNYVSYGAKDWEEKYKDLYLEHITDPFDPTYCTHYFKAVINDEYKEILKLGE